CRQIGGLADRIVLWPLGGIAYVAPPPRPGALLWSIAAGPLVNLVLVPITVALWLVCLQAPPDVEHFALMIARINGVMLVFNLLPLSPLDGGQILQALLWFVVGRVTALRIAGIIGLLIGAGLIIPCLAWERGWLALIAAFIAWRSWSGIQQARILAQLE